MPVLRILQYPDPTLKQRSKPVTEFNDDLQCLIDNMFETLYSAPGIGLAAPQVGHPLRLFVYDLKESEDAPRHRGALINPEYLSRKGSQNAKEGCLSVSEFRTWVARNSQVTISGLDRDQKKVTIEAQGLFARLIQHEMDHLDNFLFIDRISSLKRNLYLNRLKKRQKAERSG